MRNARKGYENIHFLDFQNQSNMPSIYQACDIFALTSQSETWGLAINEAMAAGKTIVVSNNAGGAIDLVKDGFNGYVLKSGAQEELIEKLCLCLPHYKALGLNSRTQIYYWSFKKQACIFIKNL